MLNPFWWTIPGTIEEAVAIVLDAVIRKGKAVVQRKFYSFHGTRSEIITDDHLDVPPFN